MNVSARLGRRIRRSLVQERVGEQVVGVVANPLVAGEQQPKVKRRVDRRPVRVLERGPRDVCRGPRAARRQAGPARRGSARDERRAAGPRGRTLGNSCAGDGEDALEQPAEIALVPDCVPRELRDTRGRLRTARRAVLALLLPVHLGERPDRERMDVAVGGRIDLCDPPQDRQHLALGPGKAKDPAETFERLHERDVVRRRARSRERATASRRRRAADGRSPSR